ncbi:MAG: hypothetical protein ACYDC2_11775 [Solirubrobacteraceae bacterium]
MTDDRRADFLAASAELADALTDDARMTRHEAVEKAAQYHTLKLAVAQTERMLKAVGDELRAYIEATGEPITGEGFPPLDLVPRRVTTYDLMSMRDAAPEVFERLVSLGCLSVNLTALHAQQRAGNIHGADRFAMHGETKALTFERRAQ